jgi:hypothetical protein
VGREAFTDRLNSLGPSLVRIKLNDSQLRELEVVPHVLALLVHILAKLSGMKLHLSLQIGVLTLKLLEFSLSRLCAAMFGFSTVILLHDLEPASPTGLISEFADSLMSFVVFAKVLTAAAKVGALEGLVLALKSMLFDVAPWDLLHAALALVVARNFQLFELVDNEGMGFAGLEAFEIAPGASQDFLFSTFSDTLAAEIDSAVSTLARIL